MLDELWQDRRVPKDLIGLAIAVPSWVITDWADECLIKEVHIVQPAFIDTNIKIYIGTQERSQKRLHFLPYTGHIPVCTRKEGRFFGR